MVIGSRSMVSSLDTSYDHYPKRMSPFQSETVLLVPGETIVITPFTMETCVPRRQRHSHNHVTRLYQYGFSSFTFACLAGIISICIWVKADLM